MKADSSQSKARRQRKASPGKPAATEQPNQSQDSRKADFYTQVALGSTHSPDPFAMPPTGDSISAHFYPWQTLETKQPLFGPPHPLAYGGQLNYAWHSFLRGPLSPFIESFGVLSPVASGHTPLWAVRSASECLDDMKCDASAIRPCAVFWCLGFGIAAAKQFEAWGVSLREFAKASPELKRYLFNEAADRAERETETVRAAMNGFCNGIAAGQAITGASHNVKWRLFVTLKWAELAGCSRGQVAKLVRKTIPTKGNQESETRQLLEYLGEIKFPVGKSGPRKQP